MCVNVSPQIAHGDGADGDAPGDARPQQIGDSLTPVLFAIQGIEAAEYLPVIRRILDPESTDLLRQAVERALQAADLLRHLKQVFVSHGLGSFYRIGAPSA
jgi:hypothetical protein